MQVSARGIRLIGAVTGNVLASLGNEVCLTDARGAADLDWVNNDATRPVLATRFLDYVVDCG